MNRSHYVYGRLAGRRESRVRRQAVACFSLRKRGSAGFSLIEVLVAMSVLLIASLGMLGSISTSSVLSEASQETTLAYANAQSMLERLRTQRFREVFVRFNGDQTDDPATGVSPGSGFDVRGLNPRQDDPDGFVGEIIFPTPPGDPGSLREDLVDRGFGFPRDLDGDRAQDADNHASDYLVLPVRVRVQWRGKSGNRQVELETTLRPR